jgi:hypothetical protein
MTDLLGDYYVLVERLSPCERNVHFRFVGQRERAWMNRRMFERVAEAA